MAVISIGSGGRVGVPELRLPPGQRLVCQFRSKSEQVVPVEK